MTQKEKKKGNCTSKPICVYDTSKHWTAWLLIQWNGAILQPSYDTIFPEQLTKLNLKSHTAYESSFFLFL